MQGFWLVVALMAWNGVILFAGIATAAAITGVWAWIWIGGNVSLAYFLNQARKHSEPERYDDRSTPEKMNSAMEHWVQSAKKPQQKKSLWQKIHGRDRPSDPG
ncbi:MAG TPA: hypothetical protein VNA15_03830 [Candidatus Angelobacter sp.]|nr:hypothetical protein [Candidatus Angelobacter sp.]